MNEVLYRKVGRRYVPVSDWDLNAGDKMRVGTFRLTYCYADGGSRYWYEVTPDTAGFVAAAMVAHAAMEVAFVDAAKDKNWAWTVAEAGINAVRNYKP